MATTDKSVKSAEAFRTISEVSDILDVPQHVLRFWEGKFTQIKPMKRGGNRRYYRPEDLELLRAISHLLYTDGYTIKGVQKLLRENGVRATVNSHIAQFGAFQGSDGGASLSLPDDNAASSDALAVATDYDADQEDPVLDLEDPASDDAYTAADGALQPGIADAAAVIDELKSIREILTS
ncbi:MAG: MerR family transcriptional regulator [Pseudomonadota bacterium]